jgi:hypothetical protein
MITLNKDPAAQILNDARKGDASKRGPWVDNIKLTLTEKRELNRAWDLLPGWTNQVNVLERIAAGTCAVPPESNDCLCKCGHRYGDHMAVFPHDLDDGDAQCEGFEVAA